MNIAVLEALADPNRYAIVELLARRGELCLCEVAESLGISSALASHHVKRLHAAGLVTTRRRGAWLHCSLDADTITALSDGLAALAVPIDEQTGGCCSESREKGPDDV